MRDFLQREHNNNGGSENRRIMAGFRGNLMNFKLIRETVTDPVLKSFLKVDALSSFDDEIALAAIDIGYGFTKALWSPVNGRLQEPIIFPSVSPLSPQDDLSGDFFVARDTRKIEHGGTVWEVGPGVYDIATQNDVRALHDNFVGSEQWVILLLGALSYMALDEIDYLVLGLPVSHMSQKDSVVKHAVGEHVINGKICVVKNVLVIPQPLGALYNYAVSSGEFERFLSTNSLVIDPGYLTFDFLVTKGFSVNAHRSGARPGGMSSILNAIASSIAKTIGSEYDDLNQIDEALGIKDHKGPDDKRTVFVYGNELDLTEHIRNTVPVIETSLNFMLNKIGDRKDIAQIILAGGPASIFSRSIKKQFPNHGLVDIESGVFVNVYGFMFWAMMVVYGQLMRQSKRAPRQKKAAPESTK